MTECKLTVSALYCYPWCCDYGPRYCGMWYENRIRRRGNVQAILPLQIHNDANVTALNKATITPTLTGQVVHAVKVGDQVQQGQTVATVDTSALQQQRHPCKDT